LEGAAVSVTALSWVFRHAAITNKADLLVALVIADHAHDDGGGAYPSVPTIARLARMSERGVHYSLKRLVHDKVLTVEDRQPGRRTVYRVVMTPAAVAGVHAVQGARGASDPCTPRQKPLQAVHPNRKEPSKNRQRARAGRATPQEFAHLDEAVIG
jgi:hypothetical protein